MRLFTGIFTWIGLISGASAQNYPLRNLTNDSTPVNYITTERPQLIEESNTAFSTCPQQLVKNGKDLYVFLNGSGRIYKALPKVEGVSFLRQDSTIHFGYNIASFAFSFQNRIYNIGGYGLWRMNGQLRVFNEKDTQWDIVKLNEEVPFLFDETNSLLWYDHKKGKLFLGYATYRNEAVGSKDIDETRFDFTTRILDLAKHEWVALGALNKLLSGKLQLIRTIGMSPWGQLIMLGDKINLIDYAQNKILLLNVNNPSYQTIFRERYGNIFYFKDSTLFYGSNTNKTLDSIPFRYADFEPTGEAVFAAPVKESFFSLYGSKLTVAIVGFLLLWWIMKNYRISIRNKKKINGVFGNSFYNGNTLAAKIIFEEKETEILNLMIRNSEKGRFTNTDEINKVLGVTKKSIEIQKKQRSDVIIGVNKKYAFVYPDVETIIQKQRSDLDKRSFDYFIDYSRLETVKALINDEREGNS